MICGVLFGEGSDPTIARAVMDGRTGVMGGGRGVEEGGVGVDGVVGEIGGLVRKGGTDGGSCCCRSAHGCAGLGAGCD